MNTVKTSLDQFLGDVELQRIISALGEEYAQAFIEIISSNYGILKKENDSSFTNLKVVPGSTLGYIKISAGKAITNNQELIRILSDLDDYYEVPNDAVTRYVYIENQQTSEEEGTVSVSPTGQITGTNTKFQEVLRGGVNYPSRIKFTNASLNTDEYDVNSVTSDTVAQLTGTNFQTESTLNYKVIGTFSKGKVIDSGKKDIFSYDKYLITISTNGSLEVAGERFKLASISRSGSVSINDLRVEIYELNAETIIGSREYTQENYVTNDELLTASIDALDQAIKVLNDGALLAVNYLSEFDDDTKRNNARLNLKVNGRGLYTLTDANYDSGTIKIPKDANICYLNLSSGGNIINVKYTDDTDVVEGHEVLFIIGNYTVSMYLNGFGSSLIAYPANTSLNSISSNLSSTNTLQFLLKKRASDWLCIGTYDELYDRIDNLKADRLPVNSWVVASLAGGEWLAGGSGQIRQLSYRKDNLNNYEINGDVIADTGTNKLLFTLPTTISYEHEFPIIYGTSTIGVAKALISGNVELVTTKTSGLRYKFNVKIPTD